MTEPRRFTLSTAMIAVAFATTLLAAPQSDPAPPTTTTTTTATSADTAGSTTTSSSDDSTRAADSSAKTSASSKSSTSRTSAAKSGPSDKAKVAPPPVKPAVMAATGPLNMLVDLSQRKLYVAIGTSPIKTFPVAVGTKAHPTPTGLFSVQHIVWNPSWHPPDAKWAKGKSAQAPKAPDNPMKVVKLFFQEPDYYVHGTDNDDSIGGAASHGCIRMSEGDVAALARLVMDRGGATKPGDWYAKVMNGTQSADVRLPRGIPFRIAP